MLSLRGACVTANGRLHHHCPRAAVALFKALGGSFQSEAIVNLVPHSPAMGEADQTSSWHAGLDRPCLVRDAQDSRQGFSCKRDHARLSPIPPFHAFFFHPVPMTELWLPPARRQSCICCLKLDAHWIRFQAGDNATRNRSRRRAREREDEGRKQWSQVHLAHAMLSIIGRKYA